MGVVTISMGPRHLDCGCVEYTGIVTNRPRLTLRRRTRLLREAQAMLADYRIDWTHYEAPVVVGYDECAHYEAPVVVGYDECAHRSGLKLAVHWVAKQGDARIVLSDVWWDEKTGAILQAGSNYGSLIF